MNPSQKESSEKSQRLPWTKPEVRPVGTVGNILQGGGGKASVQSADMGDSNKPSGQG